jgi:hypothetical protein
MDCELQLAQTQNHFALVANTGRFSSAAMVPFLKILQVHVVPARRLAWVRDAEPNRSPENHHTVLCK